MVVYQLNAAKFTVGESFLQHLGQCVSTGIRHVCYEIVPVLGRRIARPLHGLGHLLADGYHFHLATLRFQCVYAGFNLADNIAVEAAAKRRIGRKRHDCDFSGRFLTPENVLLRRTPPKLSAWVPPSYVAEGGTVFRSENLPLVQRDTCEKQLQHLPELTLVWSHAADGILRLVKLGGSHHLHRRSDLQRALHGSDASLCLL